MTATAKLNRQDAKSQLPDGWRCMKLGEAVSEAQLGFACGERDPKGAVQLRMNNVTNEGGLDWSSFIRVPADAEKVAAYCLKKGDVLFNNTNSTELVGKTALFESYDEPVVFSNFFSRIRTATEKLNPCFLALWLQQQWQRRVFANICDRWIGQSAVQRAKLLALDIALPPPAEQKRIAGILKEQMAAVDAARRSAEAQLQAAEALPAAHLRAVFSSAGAQEWPRKRLREVCEIQLGKMLSPKSKTGVRSRPYLRNANVQWNRFDLSVVLEMDFAEDEESKFALKQGDLLVCEGGEPGRSAVWQSEIDPCCYQKALHRLRPIKDCVDPHFVLYRLWLGAIHSEFSGSHAKTTIAHLPAVRLAELLIGVPFFSDQRRIASQLSTQMSSAGRLRQALAEQLDAINQLPSALLRRAFAGNL